jgi:5-hydroxyisourate hydrolase
VTGITTHVLDTARGCPAAGVAVALERSDGDGWQVLAREPTDGDGRCRSLFTEVPSRGRYRLRFDTGAYMPGGFYPEVTVAFEVDGEQPHYHVPLLLSPFGYSTYRGS